MSESDKSMKPHELAQAYGGLELDPELAQRLSTADKRRSHARYIASRESEEYREVTDDDRTDSTARSVRLPAVSSDRCEGPH